MSMMGFTMTFPVIKVWDKDMKREHIVGTNSHDTLYIDNKTGGIHYRNLQNSEETGEDGCYEFVGEIEEWEYHAEIEFVSFDELLEIYKNQVDLSAEGENRSREVIAPSLKKYMAELDKNDDSGISHT